ncbi:uncharacterized protein [Drosophila tropicalis]|uniref:uncharacterized protein isoform X11 n=1 Tax=Drosophila tropicalis TaxID=46794 RepID=UPI0035ABA031
MPIGKLPQTALPRKLSTVEACGQDSTIDSRMSHTSSGDVPKMELLKVNYVHQCKQAIMHRSNEAPTAPRLNNPARFAGYRRQPPQAKPTGRFPVQERKALPQLPPPTIESWQLLLQSGSKRSSLPRLMAPPHPHAQSVQSYDCDQSQCCSQSACSCSDSNSDSTEASTVIQDCEKSNSWNYHAKCSTRDVQRDLARSTAASSGIKSRADRIARIENRDCDSHQPPATRIPKPLTHREATGPPPKWMFQRAGASNGNAQPLPQQQSPRLQQKTKLERIHIRKKRQPLLIINQLAVEPPTGRSTVQNGQGSKGSKYTANPSSDAKRFSLESCSDSGVSSSNDCKHQQQKQQQHQQIKQTNLRQNDKCVDCVKVLENRVQTKQKQFERQIPTSGGSGAGQLTKNHVDPNDVQNFAKKSLIKATTNELLTAAAVHVKQCNIEKERKLNDLNLRPTAKISTKISIDDTWVQESCIDPNDDYMDTDSLMLPSSALGSPLPTRPTSNSNCLKIYVGSNSANKGKCGETVSRMSHGSNTSTSSSGCGGSCPDSSSICDSEQDCCTCITHPMPAPNADCCNAVGGVFWNNACYEFGTELGASACCCNISSCDEDDCSYYDGDFIVDIPKAVQSRPHSITHTSGNKKLMRKTDGIHELRPRSIDGVADSGVSMNGDAGSSPDSGDHMQTQQDAEARRLKRGHVLTELLETERIYVTEMSSILKGYCDQMQSEELMHMVPASLQGKEDVLFGNLHELYTFHNDVFLKDLENCISTTELVALCFVQRRDTFYRLYSFYCQNIPRSERLRETLVDTHLFLQECQKRLGHKLPLAAYLLKPVQRITKYQLLLKDLLRFSDSGSCTKELQKALDCMLIVLKCVNDSMHQVAITGFPTDLAQQGELLLQDSFQVWTESKKDIRLRIKPQQRHIFLYQKSMLFCKQTSKPGHNKSTYQFKHHVKMSQIGLTESVRGDTKRFEVWLQGRQEVHTLQAATVDMKNKWVAEIKRVLLNQLEELKGEKIKQYGLNNRGLSLRQTTSWDTPNIILGTPSRTISCDASSESSNRNSNCSSEDNVVAGAACSNFVSGPTDKDQQEVCGWSSDYSNSEDEISLIEDNSTPGSKFIALADYTAMGHSEVSMREGETIELLKVGCAGWWYVRVLDTNAEGWTPGAYLESINRKSSRSSSCNQERINLK